eukprot:jgi/Psemu1/291817/fgenesh1_pg.817_\
MRLIERRQKEAKRQQRMREESDSSSPSSALVQGKTPLHWACTEHMPPSLIRRLLFVERSAASFADKDGRLPLHLAVVNGLDQQVLDRIVRAHPDGLGAPDRLRHTPLRYALLKADRCRPANTTTIWNAPTTKQQALDQANREQAFEIVLFLLETMASRRKGLSALHETNLPIVSLECCAPPSVVDRMVVLGEKILEQDRAVSERLFDLVFRGKYPLTVVHRVIETTSKTIPEARLLEMVRKQLTGHYNEGCNSTDHHVIGESSERQPASVGFAKQFAQRYRKASASQTEDGGDESSRACQEWWDKLVYLIAKSSHRANVNGGKNNESLLHMALANPTSQPSMIEYICRLNPAARYKLDVATGALPIHVACQHWHPEQHGVGNDSSRNKVLNLLLAGDFDLVRRRCNGRIALHYAILSGKSLSYIQNILNLDRDTVSIPDQTTKLLPFQLAAMSETYGCNAHTGTPFGTKSTWKLNPKRTQIMRRAIDSGSIPEKMGGWYSTFRELIWDAYEGQKRPNLGSTTEYERPSDKLLHAALWNSIYIPTIAIEFIVKVHHLKVHKKELGEELAIHIAARAPPYAPFPFEQTLSMASALESIVLVDSASLRIKTNDGRLPLHIAIESGKGWEQHLRPMVAFAPRTLATRDPISGLLPFQLAACDRSVSYGTRDLGFTIVHRHSELWGASTGENAETLRCLRKRHEADKLTSIYRILRTNPTVIGMH